MRSLLLESPRSRNSVHRSTSTRTSLRGIVFPRYVVPVKPTDRKPCLQSLIATPGTVFKVIIVRQKRTFCDSRYQCILPILMPSQMTLICLHRKKGLDFDAIPKHGWNYNIRGLQRNHTRGSTTFGTIVYFCLHIFKLLLHMPLNKSKDRHTSALCRGSTLCL